MKAVIVFAVLLAVAAAYPQANWQWGNQQSDSKPQTPMQPHVPTKTGSATDEGSSDTGSSDTGSDSKGDWSGKGKGKNGGVFNDISATVGTAVVAIKGNVIYKIRYASQRTQDEEQRYQPMY